MVTPKRVRIRPKDSATVAFSRKEDKDASINQAYYVQTHFACVIKRLDLLFYQFLAKKSKNLPTAATQLQNNYATKLSLSDLNLTLKILPANLTLCVFRILSSNTTVKLLFGNGRLQ